MAMCTQLKNKLHQLWSVLIKRAILWILLVSGFALIINLLLWRSVGSTLGKPVATNQEQPALRKAAPPLPLQQTQDVYKGRLAVLSKRAAEMRQACKNLMYRTPQFQARMSMAATLIVDQTYDLLYCPVEKVGTSFWKRIFEVLENSFGDNRTMLEISSVVAHSRLKNIIHLSGETTPVQWRYLASLSSFMFTRDPFSRLFSSYLDKIFLPNIIGNNIYHRLLLTQSDDIATVRIPCRASLSFSEFCDFVANAIITRTPLDPHFSPIHQHCNVCRIPYKFVGKQETFMEDSRAIMNFSGIDFHQVSGEQTDFDEKHDEGLIQDIIHRTWKYITKHSCQESTPEVAKRLWHTFQSRGFLSESAPLPEIHFAYNDTVRVMKNFEALAIAAFHLRGSREMIQKQREKALIEAYQKVPSSTLKQLEKAFATDCQLFGYSCNVTDKFLITKR